MYEHPYLTYQVTAVETERIAQAAERRRIVAESPSRIVRHDGMLRRMLNRAVRGRRSAARAEVRCAPGSRCVLADA